MKYLFHFVYEITTIKANIFYERGTTLEMRAKKPISIRNFPSLARKRIL